MSIVWAMGGDDNGDGDGDDDEWVLGLAGRTGALFRFQGGLAARKVCLGGTGEEGSEKSVGTDSKPSDAPDALGRYQDGIRRVSYTRDSRPHQETLGSLFRHVTPSRISTARIESRITANTTSEREGNFKPLNNASSGCGIALPKQHFRVAPRGHSESNQMSAGHPQTGSEQ